MTNKTRRRISYPGLAVLTVIWTVVGSLAYARHYLEGSATPPAKMLFEFLVWLTCFYPWIALAPLIFQLERKYPIGRGGSAGNAWFLMIVSLPFSYLGAIVTLLLCLLLQAVFRESLSLAYPWWHPPTRELVIQFALYWTTIGGAYVIRSLVELSEREQEAAKLALEKSQLETTLHQAELETLRARLNPHFLFNSLQNISVLTREDPHAAGQMLARLGILLRSALRKDGTPETTLAAEVELTKAYVAVEQIRFADRLTVMFEIAADTEAALVPSLLLQPLVENAVLHGLQGIDGKGLVSIRSAVEANDLILTIADNGIGLPVENPREMELGLGLTSTIERLEKMYPGRHSFSIRSLPEGGTQVRVELPLRIGTPGQGVTIDGQAAPVAR